ncbi:TetR/AcrR family transcriptional regulator [Micromonospora sp. NPDC049171]|uniref:TetR/AcrR family transcriptional regulator n=1 Tax=Micromonospora sp. NPDC049171 TaxID=3155770 RepID=UPI0033F79A99
MTSDVAYWRVAKPSRARGRPRKSEVDRALLAATVQLLAEGLTLDALSFGKIADRAGVSKATIYRRWRDKRGLLEAALKDLERRPVRPLPRAGCAHDDLVMTLRQIRQWLHESPEAQIMPQLVGEIRRNPRLVENYFVRILQTERHRLRQILDHGVATGDFRRDLDTELVSRMLYGMLMVDMWRLFQPGPPEAVPAVDETERAVRELTRGLLSTQVGPARRPVFSRQKA